MDKPDLRRPEQEPSLSEWPDKDLVVAFKGGVPDAYDEMYRRYSDRVHFVCRRMLGSPDDAYEASQDTFLKAYVALPRFNGEYRLGAWLARIASNVCLDYIRRRGRTARITPIEDDEEVPAPEAGPEEAVILDQRAFRALDDMQPLHARALALRGLEGLSHKEIADQLDMTPLQVKALLHRARASFKRAWENASGWAMAPLFGLRSLLQQSSKDASSIGAGAPMWAQAGGPLLAEKVAASAIVVALALGGNVITTPPAVPESDDAPPAVASVGSDERDAALSASAEVPSATRPAPAPEKKGLVAEVAALIEHAQEKAARHHEDDGGKNDDEEGDEPGMDPREADRATSKLTKTVKDKVDEIVGDR